MPKRRSAFLLVTVLPAATLPVACAAAGQDRPPRRVDTAARPQPADSPPVIGSATMLADGTILLQLRAEGPGGAHGDAQLRYPTDDPHYRTVRDHLPALRPGGTVPVPPFP